MKVKLSNIVFEITNRCNLDCLYCYNIWKNPRVKDYPEDHIENRYRQIKKVFSKLFSQAEVNNITLSGGEPLMFERLEELVLFLRLRQKNLTLITNGNNCNYELYKTLINLGTSLFEIPFHSTNFKEHDKMTQIEGSAEKSLSSIDTIMKLGGKVVPVIILTKINQKHLKETLLFLKNKGLRRIMINRFNIGGNGIKYKDRLMISRNELKDNFDIINSTAGEENLDISSNVCTPVCILNPNNYKNITFGYCSTDPSNMPLTIDIYGNIRLCNHSPLIAGNIFKTDLKDILKNDNVVNWNKETPKECNNCSWYYKCLGGCRAASLQFYQESNRADPIINF